MRRATRVVKGQIAKLLVSFAGEYPPAIPQNLVRFSRPAVRDSTAIFGLTTSEKTDTFYVTVPDDFHFHNDLAAAFLVSIFGRHFPNVYFDFEVSEHCVSELSRVAGVPMRARANIPPRRVGQQAALAFSGGFDSLAGYLLCPEIYKLVSIDFGPAWQRERDFFETYDTTIIETNFRTKKYDRHHWMMMGAPLVLYADYLDMSGIGFGTIFEATPFHNISPDARHRVADDARCAVGLRDFTLTRGLTEFATALIVHRLAPDRAAQSLRSLANENSEKMFRKTILLGMAQGAGSEYFAKITAPSQSITMGQSFAYDLLYYALTSHISIDTVAPAVKNPSALRDFVEAGIDMSWVHKYNPIFIDNLPYTKVGEILSNMSDLGISIFNASDFENYQKYLNFWMASTR